MSFWDTYYIYDLEQVIWLLWTSVSLSSLIRGSSCITQQVLVRNKCKTIGKEQICQMCSVNVHSFLPPTSVDNAFLYFSSSDPLSVKVYTLSGTTSHLRSYLLLHSHVESHCPSNFWINYSLIFPLQFLSQFEVHSSFIWTIAVVFQLFSLQSFPLPTPHDSTSFHNYNLIHLYWRSFTSSPLPREESSHPLHGIQSLLEFSFYYNFLPLFPAPFHRYPALYSYQSTCWFLYWVYSIPSCPSFKSQLSYHLLYWALPNIFPTSTLYAYSNSTFIYLFIQRIFIGHWIIYLQLPNKLPPNLEAWKTTLIKQQFLWIRNLGTA